MASRQSTKIFIPHPTEENCSIAGVLEQLEPALATQGRKIALILHGTMGHKDYLFQKRLALRLPFDSFRFDFRGNHETPGTWKQGGLAEDVVDLEAVVEYLQRVYGYEIDLVVGHSRGSVVAMRWLCTSDEGKRVGGFVNVSGRYRMNKVLDGEAKSWVPDLQSKGFHEWQVSVARKTFKVKIYPEDVETFSKWDTSIVWDQFPANIDALTLHGLADKSVPPYDALIYARALSPRAPGTHSLHLIEDADHNFSGRQDEVVDTILDWWEVRQRGGLKSGVWQMGIKGKL